MNKPEKIKALEEMIQIVLLRIPKEVEAMHFIWRPQRNRPVKKQRICLLALLNREKGHEAELRRILGDLKNELEELKKQNNLSIIWEWVEHDSTVNKIKELWFSKIWGSSNKKKLQKHKSIAMELNEKIKDSKGKVKERYVC